MSKTFAGQSLCTLCCEKYHLVLRDAVNIGNQGCKQSMQGHKLWKLVEYRKQQLHSRIHIKVDNTHQGHALLFTASHRTVCFN